MLDELLLDTEDERVCVRAGATLRVLWLVERWLLTREEALLVDWLLAGVLVARLLDELRVAVGVAFALLLVLRVALPLARGVADVFRLDGDVAWLREFELRLFVVAGVTERLFLLSTVARPFARLFAVARLSTAPVPRLFCEGRTALLSDVLRALLVVARVFERADEELTRESVLARLLVVLERLAALSLRVAAERTLAASVTLAGRAVLRVF